MLGILNRARRSRFLRYNSIFFFGSIAVGALNYLYYPVMGRLLNTASFGEVQTLISLFLQITIFLSVLGLVAINVVTNYRSDTQRNAVVLEFEKLALVISAGFLLLAVVFGRQLAGFLHFESAVPFVLLMLALMASVPLTFRGAFLRGRQRFGAASGANLAGAAGKLILAALLVGAGLSTIGAISGLVAAQLVACGLAAAWAARAGLHRPPKQHWLQLPNLRLLAPELRYGLLVLIGSLVVTLQYSLDVIVVKHYFDPHTAGLYAGVATVARMVFFVTASIALVMMSLVRVEAPRRDNHKVLLGSLLLTIAVGLPIVVLGALEPTRVTNLLMGGSYANVANLLPKLSLAIFIVSILNVCVSYFLALRQYAVAPVLLLGAGVTYALMYSRHATLSAVVTSLLAGSIAMLGLLVIWVGGRQLREIL